MFLLRALISVTSLLALVRAQEQLWVRSGTPNEVLGRDFVVVGDLNGDGWDDLACTGGRVPAESVLFLLSGRDGSTLRFVRREPPDPQNFSFERCTAAGDWNRDSIPDYAIVSRHATTQTRSVEVCSGANDQVLWRVDRSWSGYFGYTLLGNLDLDGNGRPDLLVSDPRAPNVEAFGDSGQRLYVLGCTPSFCVGVPLDRMGDLDRDGAEDFVMGGGLWKDPRGGAMVVSGRTGTLIVRGIGELPGDYLGYSVAGCGDIDGDTYPDFAAGNSDFYSIRGVVRVFSGRTGEPLYTWTGRDSRSGDSFGFAVAGGNDIDRDGVPDVVIGAPSEPDTPGSPRSGYAYVFSGREGTRLWNEGPIRSLGWHVATQRAQPGNPFPLFAASTPLLDYGAIRCYRGSPPGVQGFGRAAGGHDHSSALRIGMRDLGTLGVRIHLSGAEPGRTALLALGLSSTSWAGQPLPLALDPVGLPGCLLYTSVEVLTPVLVGTAGVAAGYASVEVPLPLLNPGTVTLHGQWLVPWASGGAKTSDALRWRH